MHPTKPVFLLWEEYAGKLVRKWKEGAFKSASKLEVLGARDKEDDG